MLHWFLCIVILIIIIIIIIIIITIRKNLFSSASNQWFLFVWLEIRENEPLIGQSTTVKPCKITTDKNDLFPLKKAQKRCTYQLLTTVKNHFCLEYSCNFIGHLFINEIGINIVSKHFRNPSETTTGKRFDCTSWLHFITACTYTYCTVYTYHA